MIVYRKNDVVYDYPEDMYKILGYLTERGTLLIDGETVERYYMRFSEEKYCAGWMTAHDETIAEFADWLAEIDE